MEILCKDTVSISRNYTEIVPLHKISTLGDYEKLRYFTQCLDHISLVLLEKFFNNIVYVSLSAHTFTAQFIAQKKKLKKKYFSETDNIPLNKK